MATVARILLVFELKSIFRYKSIEDTVRNYYFEDQTHQLKIVTPK